MISSQCDKLRETADEIQRIKNNNADWLWRDAITLSDAVEQIREAADLILELRDDLQRANDAVRDAEHDESMAWDRVRKAEAESEKLRELVRDYEHCSVHADCDRCEYDGTTSTHCPLSPCFPDINELRELGVEVDE